MTNMSPDAKSYEIIAEILMKFVVQLIIRSLTKLRYPSKISILFIIFSEPELRLVNIKWSISSTLGF